MADINVNGTDGSNPYGFTVLGDYIYFNAGDGGTIGKLWRVNAAGVVDSGAPVGTNAFFGCMCDHPLLTLNGRLFAPLTTDETDWEFAWLEEPSWVMPETNRNATPWSSALVLLSALTAAGALALRMRVVKRA